MLHLVVLKDNRSLANVKIEVTEHSLPSQHLVTVSYKSSPVLKYLTTQTAPLSIASEVLAKLAASVRRMPVREDRR